MALEYGQLTVEQLLALACAAASGAPLCCRRLRHATLRRLATLLAVAAPAPVPLLAQRAAVPNSFAAVAFAQHLAWLQVLLAGAACRAPPFKDRGSCCTGGRCGLGCCAGA